MIASNQATGGRGGDGTCTFTGVTYQCNGGSGGAGQGGGLYVNGGSLTLATSTLATNQATAGAAGNTGVGQRGGLVNAGMLTVGSSTLSGNTASGSQFALVAAVQAATGGRAAVTGPEPKITLEKLLVKRRPTGSGRAPSAGIPANGGTLEVDVASDRSGLECRHLPALRAQDRVRNPRRERRVPLMSSVVPSAASKTSISSPT